MLRCVVLSLAVGAAASSLVCDANQFRVANDQQCYDGTTAKCCVDSVDYGCFVKPSSTYGECRQRADPTGGDPTWTGATEYTEPLTHVVYDDQDVGSNPGSWFNDASEWTTLPTGNRFPRGGDRVIISAGHTVTFTESLRPNGANGYFYDGATEGTSVVVSAGSKITVGAGSTLKIGPQVNAPVDCVVSPTWTPWHYDTESQTCSAACDGGIQSRSRSFTNPRYGGDKCPEACTTPPCNTPPYVLETATCNNQPCECTTTGGTKTNGARYGGFGPNHCNECSCVDGTEHCTTRDCDISSEQICDKTTCVYGVRLDDDPEHIMTVAELIAQYPDDNFPPFEYTTLVKHNKVDANGEQFKCGHDGNDCKCYCGNGTGHQIWHRAPRHPDAVSEGLTQAGCKCNGPCDTTTKPHLCPILAGSCPSNVNTVTHSATHDVCAPDTDLAGYGGSPDPYSGMRSHYKVLIPQSYKSATHTLGDGSTTTH